MELLKDDQQSRIWPDAQPFWLRSAAPAAVICLHGFMATPYEVKPIAQACNARHLDVLVPLLPGHGYREVSRQKQEIAKISPGHLLRYVRDLVDQVRQDYSRVGLYGQSMGGALALAIASEGLVDAVAVTAPALKMPWWVEFLLFFLGWSELVIDMDFLSQPFYNPYYKFGSAPATSVLKQIAEYSQARLGQLHCPVYVAHSHSDSLIDPVVCEWIRSQAKGPVTIEWFDRSDHTMPLDVQGPEVATAIGQFLQQQLNPPSAESPRAPNTNQ